MDGGAEAGVGFVAARGDAPDPFDWYVHLSCSILCARHNSLIHAQTGHDSHAGPEACNEKNDIGLTAARSAPALA